MGLFNRNKFYVISHDVFGLVSSFDGNFYICKTCGKKLKKNCIPCQAVCNLLEVCELPTKFRDIQRLERVLVARRLLFKKINIMLKGQSTKLRGSLCNIPIDLVHVCNTLPSPAGSNGIIIVKLKRNLQYRGHVYFESVRPNFILKFAQYLKLNNPMYHDIGVLDNIPSFLIDKRNQDSLSINVLNNINIDNEIPIIVEKNGSNVEEEVESDIHSTSSNLPIPSLFEKCDDTEGSNSINIKRHLEKVDITSNPISDVSDPIDFTIHDSIGVVSDRKHEITNSKSIDNNSNIELNDSPLDTCRCSASETVLVNTSCENKFISIAPGENVRSESLNNYIFCEELNHPHLFPTGKFGFQTKRKVYLTPTKYFNQCLLSYTQKFSSDSDYIFFAHSVMQKVNLSNQINIAMRKVTSSQLTAGMLSSKFNEKVKELINSDQVFTFMNSIKGASAYWKKFLFDVWAVVKQLGLPTFFITLSSAALKWNELVSIINKQHELNMLEEDI